MGLFPDKPKWDEPRPMAWFGSLQGKQLSSQHSSKKEKERASGSLNKLKKPRRPWI